MYVCLCKGVTDRQIKVVVDSGCRSFDELAFELGVGTCCGRCTAMARSMVESASGETVACGLSNDPSNA